ncbi:MAG TPA: SPOR domain-containing protein [Gemmatimonadales bacterium]|jgi:hypothetical protein
MVTQLLTADLGSTVPDLLAGSSVVAIVPATELLGWSAEMAWEVARAAASGGRRTVLIDCFVDAPTLHGVHEGNTEGLVDAFEYGASLNRIVQQQPQADLFFIPAGTYTAAAEPLMQHPRWKRLSAGFRHEEALLLLYVSAEHLAGLAAEPDGLIVLAPQGQGLAAAESPALAEAVGRGMPLLAVVADESAVARASGAHPMPTAPPPAAHELPDVHEEATLEPVPVRPSRPSRASAPFALLAPEEPSSSRGIWMLVILVVALAGLALAYRFGGLELVFGTKPRGQPTPAAARAPAPTTAPAAPRDSAMPAAPATLPAHAAALPLPFVVQVAALPSIAGAFTLRDTLAAHGTPALVAPVRLGATRGIYRVDAGPFATRRSADSTLAALRQAGLLPPNAGLTLSLPLSISLGSRAGRAEAEAERARLRAAGVPAFILGQPDGTFMLFAGAYDVPAQASLLQDLLTPTGSADSLVPRSGYLP